MSNKIEQEAKFLISDLTALEKGLLELGAQPKQARIFELNLRFDTPDRRLSDAYQALRLRQDTVCRLTFKGASDPYQDISARAELEVQVSDLETARAILEALGFVVMVRYEKYRSTYILDEVEVSLDEMPFGNFCEIEGANRESIQQTAHRLRLNWAAHTKMSYLMLFERIKQVRGLSIPHLTFDAFLKIDVSWADIGLMPADA